MQSPGRGGAGVWVDQTREKPGHPLCGLAPLHVQSVTLGHQTGYLLIWISTRYTCTGHLQSRDINLEISAGLDIYLLPRYLEVGNLITRYLLARYTIQTRYGSPHRTDIPGCQGEEGTYDA